MIRPMWMHFSEQEIYGNKMERSLLWMYTIFFFLLLLLCHGASIVVNKIYMYMFVKRCIYYVHITPKVKREAAFRGGMESNTLYVTIFTHNDIFHIKSFENCENASLLRCNKTEWARERKNISSINLNFLLFDGEQYKMPYVYQTLIKYLMMYLCAASVYISKRFVRFDSDRASECVYVCERLLAINAPF